MVIRMELDPEESIMSMKLATFIVENIDYDRYYTPGDFTQRHKFWTNIGLLVGVSKHINPRCFTYGNFEYDPCGELYKVLKTLQIESSNKFFELLSELLKKIDFEKIVQNDPQAYLRLNRYLSVFGFEVDENFNLLRSSMVSETRKEDRHQMFALLEAYPAENEALKGAIERYSEGGSDAFRQCLDSCRNVIESLVKKLSGSTDWKSGLSKIISSKNGRDTIKQFYSFLSARGVHGDTIPSQEDTELGLKLTEDCMLWILKKVK
jgi:hypothetical protein